MPSDATGPVRRLLVHVDCWTLGRGRLDQQHLSPADHLMRQCPQD